ncbi:MAG TPA: flagellar brake domain-containing protein [Phycisphaerales bacterium]|nr:flagellar brake domain-containing protein [Phycisphaerales bacterium]
MPANRSRTDRWRDLLLQIAARGGGLEYSVAKPEGDTDSPDLVWRSRLLAVGNRELVLEHPVAMNQPVKFEEGTRLVGVMAVGQNRWMFHTRVVGASAPEFSRVQGLRIEAPETVERCARRDFLRISTAALCLPEVECWPLLDPTTVTPAEIANRAAILEMQQGGDVGLQTPDSILLPEVGPPFSARLMNIGGGGVGLMIGKNEAVAAERSRLIWMRVKLMPHIPAPLALTGRVVHTHLDSAQNLYAGVAFEFAFNPAHKDFVVSQVARYVNHVQASARRAA